MNSKEILRKACEVIPQNAKVLLAFSGGSDSSALLHFLREERPDLQLQLAHFNHRLRPESDAEALALQKLATSLQIPFFTESRSHDYESGIEEEARKERYAFFETLQQIHSFDAVLLAHHAKDDQESFWFNFFRGGKISAMRGMPQQRGIFLRPWLHISKQVILDYLKEEKITYFEDSSNQEERFTRNRLRLQFLPWLQENFPAWFKHWPQQKSFYSELEDFLQHEAAHWVQREVQSKESGFSFSKQAFLALHPFMQKECLAFLCRQQGQSPDHPSLERWQKAIQSWPTGKKTEWCLDSYFLLIQKESILISNETV